MYIFNNNNLIYFIVYHKGIHDGMIYFLINFHSYLILYIKYIFTDIYMGTIIDII